MNTYADAASMKASKNTPTAARGRNLLMTPGPTNVPDRVLQAMNRPAIELTGETFIALCRSCISDLKPLFETTDEVFIYPANGHGAWEAALVNTLAPGDRVLVPETGLFSFFWARMAEALGVEFEEIPGDWRSGADAQEIERRLRADTQHQIKAILLVHTDTATGVTSDIPAVRKALDDARHPALLMVDAVASLAASPMRMDEWGVDVAVGASQKALMASPGLSFTAVSQKALAYSSEVSTPRYYWDWRRRQSEQWFDWFCGTAPQHLMFGLRESLDMIAEETLPEVFARHHRLAQAVRAAISVWSEGSVIELNAQQPGEQADSVTTVLVDAPFDAYEIIGLCRDRFNVCLAGGLGKLDGHSIRVGHMGDINEGMILGTLGALETAFALLGVPRGEHALDAAVEALRRAWT